MGDDKLALRLGAGVIGLIMAGGVAMLLLQHAHVRPGVRVEVSFSHLASIEEGSEVQVAGRVIGSVTGVRLLSRRRGDPSRESGGVTVDLWIDRRRAWMVPVNGEWFINSKGILGERYIEIARPIGDAAPGRPVQNGDQVVGTDPARLDRLASRSLENITQMRALAREILPEARKLGRELDALGDALAAVEPNQGAYARTWAAQKALFDEGAALLADWRAIGTDPAELAALARRAAALLERTRGQVADLRGRAAALGANLERVRGQVTPERLDRFAEALRRADALLAKVDVVLAQARALADFVERGGGTIGAFLGDPELADDAKGLGKIMKRQPWNLIGHPQPE